MRKTKWSASALAVLMVPVMVLYTSGCPTVAQWIQIGVGLVPIVLQTVAGFQTANGGLSPAAEATITKFSDDATAILKAVEADINTAKTDVSIIPKIDAELANLQTQAQALIPMFTGNTKVLAWVNAILADAIDIANLIPVVQQTATSPTGAARVTVVKTKVSLMSAKTYENVFKLRLANAQAQ